MCTRLLVYARTKNDSFINANFITKMNFILRKFGKRMRIIIIIIIIKKIIDLLQFNQR